MTLTLTNARIVTPEGLHHGSLTVENGRIAALDAPARGTVLDLGGDLLLPGLIDLHGDAIEKEVEPRPNAFFPLPVAMGAIDRRMAAAGVTTAFHGISFAEGELGVRDVDFAETLARALHGFAGAVDHRVHIRYELTDAGSEARVTRLIDEGVASLLSFMDHTPGQGQFKDAATYGAYLSRVYAKEEGEILDRISAKQAEAGNVVARVERLAAHARPHGVALAGHDDEGAERVEFMARIGATISEFPLDLATAQAAREAGLVTLFGAPNVLRGRSQSGALSAREAIGEGVAGALCSDYAPQAMLPALGVLTGEMGLDWPRALDLVAGAPARATGLTDRGVIATSKRADLIRVQGAGSGLSAAATWVAGRQVYGFGSAQSLAVAAQ
ncbi:MAG: alpha-D-ribose 1-methylphosphonate 5-triphosphate diphosphatase [Roseovarius sp.]|nr:alpha-D-ribose 1-methylphosphonate 5-triphosphate diphosphatase [Roseovarius sp.]